MISDDLQSCLIPGLNADLIRAAYADAPGNEIHSGKFFSPESSSALVANAFGLFLGNSALLPALPGCDFGGWSARSVKLEAIIRFPWQGGRHPCLDVAVETETALVGVESKRFEPYRPKSPARLSEAYWRPLWGENMRRYEQMRDSIKDGSSGFRMLDAGQLVKHAFGLRTAVHRPEHERKTPILLYLFCEPKFWPDGRVIPEKAIQAHRQEAERFADLVVGDEVIFLYSSYGVLIEQWERHSDKALQNHAAALRTYFKI
jgi:hypothetical protein